MINTVAKLTMLKSKHVLLCLPCLLPINIALPTIGLCRKSVTKSVIFIHNAILVSINMISLLTQYSTIIVCQYSMVPFIMTVMCVQNSNIGGL